MKIRKAKIADSEKLLKILRETPELQPIPGEDNYDLKGIKKTVKNKYSNIVILAEEKKELIGFLIAEFDKRKNTGFVINLYVAPAFRKKGVASILLGYFETFCRKNKINEIGLLTLHDNKNMQEFLQKNNYRKGGLFFYYLRKL